jgi:hypothetical protein
MVEQWSIQTGIQTAQQKYNYLILESAISIEYHLKIFIQYMYISAAWGDWLINLITLATSANYWQTIILLILTI